MKRRQTELIKRSKGTTTEVDGNIYILCTLFVIVSCKVSLSTYCPTPAVFVVKKRNGKVIEKI